MHHYLSSGQTPELLEVLDQKEARVRLIETLKSQYPTSTMVCFKLNIPGPVKNNEVLKKVFEYGQTLIINTLSHESINYEIKEVWDKSAGMELFIVCHQEGQEIKDLMVELEENSPLGRLFDIDVENGDGAISRKEERRCFICDKPAKICARSRAHSVQEMILWIEQLLYENEKLWKRGAYNGTSNLTTY